MLLFWFLASPLVCFMFNKFVESVSLNASKHNSLVNCTIMASFWWGLYFVR